MKPQNGINGCCVFFPLTNRVPTSLLIHPVPHHPSIPHQLTSSTHTSTSSPPLLAPATSDFGALCWCPLLAQKEISQDTSSTAQGGGGSFKNRKPIGEIGCCESGMAERSHWWTKRCLRSPLFRSLSLTIYLCIYVSMYPWLSMYLCIYVSIYVSIYLSTYLSICLSIYLPIYLSVYLSIYLSLSLSSNYLSIYLSTYLPIYLSPPFICLSV